VWNDTNADGVQDVGETGISGATVNLRDSTGTTVLQTTSTNGSGNYSFTAAPGTYIVEFVTPGGYTHSPQDQGGDDTQDSDASTTTGRTGAVTVAAGVTNSTVDAGFYGNPSNIVKSLVGPDETLVSSLTARIGEIVTYQVTVNVPPGVFTGVTLVDTMQQGLAFVACDSITAGAGLTTTAQGGSFSLVCSSPTVAPGVGVDVDRIVTFDFGNLTNSSGSDQALTITYFAVVLDSAGNLGVPQTNLQNGAVFHFNGSALAPSVLPTVRVVEPQLTISKSADILFITNGSNVTFTLTIAHTAQSQTDAYDLVVEDPLPTGLDYVSGSLDCTVGAQDPDPGQCYVYDNAGVPTVHARWSVFNRLPLGANGQIRFTVQGNGNLPPNGSVTNTASVVWTSLPADVSTPQSFTPNPYSTERFYDPNDPANINNYTANSSLELAPLGEGEDGGRGRFVIPVTGFAPGHFTDLSDSPFTSYAASDDLDIQIPSQNLIIPIVGVALENGTWNVDWLWNVAGWLQGTAYPTYSGNSVITAHVVNSDGKAGPFARLKRLQRGDRVYITSNGYRYVYVVRSTRSVQPDDITILRHKDTPWLTLVTCDQYDAKTGLYLRRVVVSAELVQVISLGVK
jgi:LPXTG-site transpeptidase (sortase) family protein